MKTARAIKLEPRFRIAFNGLLAVPCRCHALYRKIHLCPAGILRDVIPVAAEACCLAASAAAAGSPVAGVPVEIRVAAAEPVVSPAPVRNLAARCQASSGNSDARLAHCGCCYRAAADGYRGRLTSAAPAACSLAAAAAACLAD